MHFNSIKTATLGAFAIVMLGTSAISGTAQARPYEGDANWNGGWGRYSDWAGQGSPAFVDNRFPDARSQYAMEAAPRGKRSRRGRTYRSAATPVTGGGFGGDLVSEARRYIGGNPTGRSSLWCGAFMDLILQRTGHRPGSNLARDYANYGARISGPQVGAIAVMGRRGGGHVGVVSGIDESGNPIIISGNHGHRVAEATYSRGRVYAYVMP